MRVLQVISGIDPQNGGPTTALLGFSAALARQGVDVCVLATWYYDTGPAFARQFRNAGVEVRLVGPCKLPLMRHPDLRATTRQEVERADVVHIHAMFEQVQHEAAVAARALARPYLMVPHGGLHPWSLAQSRLKKRLYLAWRLRKDLAAATALHYCTPAERDHAAAMKLPPPTLVEPNGIEPAEFATLPKPGLLRKRFPQIGKRPVAIFLGRLHKKKGLDVLLPAFAAYRKARPEAAAGVLVLAGPDDAGYGQVVRDMIQQHRLSDDVVLAGMLHGRDRLAALVEADVFVLSSYTENFGIVALEAMACDTPILISDRVEIASMLQPEDRFGQVLPLEPAAFAEALAHWLHCDGVEGEPFGQTTFGRQAALGRFTWDAIAARWVAHYERLRGETA